jgi:bacillithiol system protein YtxJ
MKMFELTNQNQISEIDALSASKPVIIFKHSTRCSISSTALNRFEKLYANEDSNELPAYYLDLIKHRDISNLLAQHYNVEHQSPQTLLIQNGKCTHHASHFEIDLDEIRDRLAN